MAKSAEEIRAANRAACRRWREKHREYNLERQRKWRDENRELYRACQRKWSAANPEKLREKDRRRRERQFLRHVGFKARMALLNRIPAWSETPTIARFYRNRPAGHDVDHVIPLRGRLVSGLHVLSNLQYLPAIENRRKSNRFSG